MGETSRIYAVIDEARRRLRIQAALEVATTLSILASALAAVSIYLYRRDLLGGEATVALLLGGAGIVVIGAIAGRPGASRPTSSRAASTARAI